MPNRLASATSPYLLQHQDNPVDWWEWSDEAFDEAKKRDVPVLLSVGYSACHWCHVMAHESFEDPETAAEMNRRFVNVKVDREERPDVDSIYMEAVQAMTGRGGWPMTVWLTPDRQPFFAGTYFPKDPHHGMASFRQVLEAIDSAWQSERASVEEQAERLVAAITNEIPGGRLPDVDDLQRAAQQVMGQFDRTFGGFGGAPKFPQQPTLEFLLRWRGQDRANRTALDEALTVTLHRMADGGIHDHLAGGFSRYSVDQKWLVPHFEKMLYDNAQLARIYLWAGVELGEPRFVEVARSVLSYLADDMRHASGGFYSAEDADSDGVEGKFYVWDLKEFDHLLGTDASEAARYYGVTEEGNFEGKNILHLKPEDASPPNLDRIRATLLTAREERIRPGLDDKVVTAWNGLALRSFAEAGATLDDEGLLAVARQNARFLVDTMIMNGLVMRSWREGRHSGPGFLDDYAALALGLIALYQATGEVEWFEVSKQLVASFDQFSRPEGGYYSTSDDQPDLVKRPVELTDNPQPSGNALAAEANLMMSLLTGEHHFRDKAVDALAAVGSLAERFPSMVGHHLAVTVSVRAGTKEVAIVGENRTHLVQSFWESFRPHAALAHADSANPDVPLLADRTPVDGKAAAYVCQGFVCDLPVTDSGALRSALNRS